MLKVYYYQNCDTCKDALRFLKKQLVRADYIDLVERPPGVEELRTMLEFIGGDIKKMFNTSGRLFHAMKIKELLPKLTTDETLNLLSKHGKLIKRPILLGITGCVVGFREKDWMMLAIQEEMNT